MGYTITIWTDDDEQRDYTEVYETREEAEEELENLLRSNPSYESGCVGKA